MIKFLCLLFLTLLCSNAYAANGLLVKAAAASGTYSCTVGTPTFPISFSSAILPSGVCDVRASKASYYNSSGYLTQAANNRLRFDYNPSTLTYLGALIEPTATNLVYPSFITSTGWTVGNSALTLNAAISPDGTNDATYFKEVANAGGAKQLTSTASVSVTSGHTYTIYTYAKKNTEYVVQLWIGGGIGGYYANFDLNAGTPGTTTATSSGMVSVGNGWYICWMKFNATATSTSSLGLALTNNNSGATGRLPTYTAGATGLGVYVAGAQWTESTTYKTYIPTTTASAIQAADSVQFTIPSGITTLTYTFDDSTTQSVSVSSGLYTVPTNLNRPHIMSIAGS